MKIENNDTFECLTHTLTHKSVMAYLQQMSGQEKRHDVIEVDHSYAKPWNRHPDAMIRAKAAKFLFMKNFPKHFLRREVDNESDNYVDIEMVDRKPTLAILNGTNYEHSFKTTLNEADINSNELPLPAKNGWTPQMNKLWTKAMKILHSDRLARLSYEGQLNEAILKRNLADRGANKFRHLFASSGWDFNLVSWLNNTLNEYVGPLFIASYHESMQILRVKIPNLIDKFYFTPKCESQSRLKQNWDPIQAMLNNYKPKRINGSPLFLIVPNGPQIPHQMTSQRMKHWHNLFGSMGKVINISVISRPKQTAADFLNDIRIAVRDKIKECKSTFNEGRPLVLVGFGHSSLIAAHCALDNAPYPKATICLGFPLTAINGFRGDLDDPLLETTVPTLFVIGQNSTMATLDDMEDFRERITKTETGLVVIGGANDRLIVSSSKKKFENITQSMVDRCIADEIYEFVNDVINKNAVSTDYSSFPSVSGINMRSHSPIKSPRSVSDFTTPKTRKRRTPRDRDRTNVRTRRVKREKTESVSPVIPKTTDNTVSTNENTVSTATSESLLPKSLTSSTDTLTPTTHTETDKSSVANPTPIAPFVLSLSEKTDKTPDILNSEPDLSNNLVVGGTATATAITTGAITTTINSSTASVAPCSSTANSTQSQNNNTKMERHYGLSYGVSEFPTFISRSATRHGRQIRAPKGLDV